MADSRSAPPGSPPAATARKAAATPNPAKTHSANRPPISAAGHVDDTFFRHLVAHMRNGVLAISRTGELVLINDEACRIFGLPAGEDYLGRSFAEVFAAHPDIVRVLASVFELETLPNRAEVRLKPTDKVI